MFPPPPLPPPPPPPPPSINKLEETVIDNTKVEFEVFFHNKKEKYIFLDANHTNYS